MPARLELIYDGQCPVCRSYITALRVRRDIGELVLVDAREAPGAVQALAAQGLDIDQGMVLSVDDTTYHGSEAMHALALMAGPSSWLNRLMHWCFRNRLRARILYPLLVLGRRALLKLLGRPQITPH